MRHDAGMAAVRRYKSADGVELVADVAGPADSAVVVLLHGGGQTRHSWSGAMRALVAHRYRVINVDARGHGDSGWAPDAAYTLDDRVADVRAVTAGLDAPYALVGASLGGDTAIHAVASGLSPAAVVLVDVVPEPEADGVARIVDFMRGNPDGFATLEDAADAIAAYNPERPRPSDASGLMRNLRLRPNGRLHWHWDPRTIDRPAHEHHAIVRQSAAEMAGHASLPMMLIRGLKSDVVSDAGVAAFRAMMPRLEVVDVGGAGHMVAGDRNDAFNTGVIEFLLRHMPASVAA